MCGTDHPLIGYVSIRNQIGPNNAYQALSNYAPTYQSWHHAYFEWNGSTNFMQLYIDGVFQNYGVFSASGGTVGINNNSVYFGADANMTTGHFLTGELDDIRLYNRGLSESEILALFEEGQSWSCGEPLTYEGQQYNTVQIGTQCWMAENLNVGTKVNTAYDQFNNNIVEKYCYNNSDDSCGIYGGLYQWPEMMQYVSDSGAQGICPNGWHIPTNSEWNILEDYIPEPNIGKKLQAEGNPCINDGCEYLGESGFDALLGGLRYYNGSSLGIREAGDFWTSSESNSGYPYTYKEVHKTYPYVNTQAIYGSRGFSVRCLKDESSVSLNSDFSATPLEGYAPLNVVFTDESIGNPTIWKWDFQNDGIYDSFIQNPSFTYTQPGTYSVKLYVENANETDFEVKYNYISVIETQALNADFSAEPLEGIVPLTVQFTDESIGSPSVWIWDFQNDGVNDAFIQNPTFTYEEPGEYSVKLIVINATETDTLVEENYITVNQASNEDSLVAFYPFNGNAMDETGNGHDGTVYGGATLTSDRFGNENSAYSFNGSSGYIETANSTNLNFPQYSISVWVNFTQSHIGNVFSKHNAGVNGGFSVGVLNQKIRFYAAGAAYDITSTEDYNDGSWHHVAALFSGDSAYLYIDGYLDTKCLAYGYVSTTAPVLIGQAGNYFFNGKADDIRFYSKVLSAEEILELYNENQITTPEICIVSVTPDEHNQIIWEKASSGPIETYNIYRETTQTNVYEVIGSVAYADSSIFVDITSNPNQRPYKYKLSAVSNSGTETVLSNYHRTIHLTINQGPNGWNLIWSPYEGILFNTYYIYRGTTQNSLTLLDSISGSFTSYTDINPPWGPLYYAVEIVNDEGCNPSRSGGYDRSRSNVQYNGVVGIEDNFDAGIKIYPNPTHDVLNISFDGNKGDLNADITISDIQGKIVISQRLQEEQTRINIGNLEPGIFIIRVTYNQSIVTKKLIVF
jgi:uncharacterized protein (TIGR02145 family)